jgi:hypothetical protein
MKRPVGWSYFLPLGNEICVVDAIAKEEKKRRRVGEEIEGLGCLQSNDGLGASSFIVSAT